MMIRKILYLCLTWVSVSYPVNAMAACCSDEQYAAEVKRAIGFNQPADELFLEANKKAIAIKDDGVQFILTDNNSYIFNGERSEMSVQSPYQIGDTVLYQFSFRLLDSPVFSEGWDGVWVIVAQWHDQPDPRKGETWSNYKSSSPPLSYQLEYDDRLYLVLHSANHDERIPVLPNQQISCRTQVHWLYETDGQVSGWCDVDGVRHPFDFSDDIMINDYYHYFKFGLYRDKNIDELMGIEYNALTISEVKNEE
ncbi:heparin lyase I family protein [Vibrio mangrovi]|uniref:Heparin lyase I family protein n=1 Tax=Vibrio mangrovi TaxID=474394 RepID=A0A1Y6IUI1_9VIBR|nr:heparin lyase I family protein [Vibrio mangrovi]MDW6003095.1 heparin lyase I family protein [Vibrio mangrovi]SMS01337.1 hypothetical protein VIM7927_02623 [Vibrio mangrovi]